jgi:hypothetical protein
MLLGFDVTSTVSGLRDVAGKISGIVGTVPNLSDSKWSGMTVKEPYGAILGIFSLVGFLSPVKCIHQLTRPGTLLTFLVSDLCLTPLQWETPRLQGFGNTPTLSWSN